MNDSKKWLYNGKKKPNISNNLNKPITNRQKQFIRLYLQGLSNKQISREIGFTIDYIYRLLRNERIQYHINKMSREKAHKLGITEETCIKGMVSIAKDKNNNATARLSAYTRLYDIVRDPEPEQKQLSQATLLPLAPLTQTIDTAEYTEIENVSTNKNKTATKSNE